VSKDCLHKILFCYNLVIEFQLSPFQNSHAIFDKESICLKQSLQFESRAIQAEGFRPRRDALLDRAAFYLLWQSGLRKGEVEELRLEDLDLEQKRLTVRQSKGLKDRTVFMTETTVHAIREYRPCAERVPPSMFSYIETNR
jgi:integrase